MKPWKIVVLEHDSSSKEIADFFEKIWNDGITRKKIDDMYKKDVKEDIIKKMENAVGKLEGKILTLYGKGTFHHYTYGLCKVIAHKRSKNYMYLQLDNHTDSRYKTDGTLDKTAFVENLDEEPEAKDILFVGVKELLGRWDYDHTIISQEELASKESKKILRKALRKKLYPDVYPSLDLDVLARTEINTEEPQGILELKHLLDILEVIEEEKNIISADILGYSNFDYSKFEYLYSDFKFCNKATSLLAYATLAAKITGKDTKELEKLHNCFKKKDSTDIVKEEFEKITEQLKI